MYKTHIYLTLDRNGSAPAKRKYRYTITADHSVKTVSGGGEAEGTMHHVTLMALVEALGRFRENAQITIHAEDNYVLTRITGSLPEWMENGFRKKDGSPLTDADLWQRLSELVRCQKVLMESGRSAFTEVHLMEMQFEQ